MTIKDDKTHIDLVEHLAGGVSIIRERPEEPKAGEQAEPPVPDDQSIASEPPVDTEK